jgi:hypothetical protein
MKPTQRDLYDELVMYPKGKHDDLLDGLYYANKNTYVPEHVDPSMATPVIREKINVTDDWHLA